MIKSNIWKIYAKNFSENLLIAWAVHKLYFTQALGITMQEMAYFTLAITIVHIILEIPSGFIADKLGLKKTLLVAKTINIARIYFYINAKGLLDIVIAYAMSSVASSLKSGAEEAMIYESLKEENRKEQYEKVLGMASLAKAIGFGLGIFLGSIIFNGYNYRQLFIITLIPMSISYILLLIQKEPDIEEKKDSSNLEFKKAIKEAFRELFSSKQIVFVIIYSFIVKGIVRILGHYDELYLIALSLPVVYWGVIRNIFNISEGIGGILSQKLKERYGYKNNFTVIIIISSILLYIFTMNIGLATILVMSILLILGNIGITLTSGYINDRVSSKLRATTLSIKNLIFWISFIGFDFMFGFISDREGIFIGARFFAVIVAIYMIYYMSFKNKVLDKEKTVEMENI
ncbi:MAG: MFS transporter [Clostridia bacterium]|jgi:hypothetical protein|nr:MFS transporter [Clostridia bacterium]